MSVLAKDMRGLADAIDKAKERLYEVIVLMSKIEAKNDPDAIALMKQIDMKSLDVSVRDVYYGTHSKDLRAESVFHETCSEKAKE